MSQDLIPPTSSHYLVIYWVLSSVTLAVGLFVTFAPEGFRKRVPGGLRRVLDHPATWLILAGLTIVAYRWPATLYPLALNVDESQVLAQGITIALENFFEGLAFYGAVQSGSTGQLWTYPLLLPKLFGFDITFGSARAVGMLIIWVSCVIFYFTVRRLTDERSARVATWLAVLCFGLGFKPDFLHYSSETPCFPLIAGATMLLFGMVNERPERARLRAFAYGVLLGFFPFAKLQATVIGLAMAGLGFLATIRASDVDFRERLVRCALLSLGGISAALFFFSAYFADGVLEYFWKVYIVNNYDYKEAGDSVSEILAFYGNRPKMRQLNYDVFWITTTIFILARIGWWILDKPNRALRPWRPLLYALVLLGATWFAVMAPGRGFPHYFLFTIMPISLVCGILLNRVPADRQSPAEEEEAPGFSLSLRHHPWLGATCLLLPMLVVAARPLYYRSAEFEWTPEYFLPRVKEFADIGVPMPSRVINEVKLPGDRLMVWGWRADYHVETQLPMATRSACPEFQIRRVPLRDYYRQTALEELAENRPAFIVDAVGQLSLNFDDPRLFGLYIFPELAEFVRSNYTLVLRTEWERLYVRNDRARPVTDWLAAQGYGSKKVEPAAKTE